MVAGTGAPLPRLAGRRISAMPSCSSEALRRHAPDAGRIRDRAYPPGIRTAPAARPQSCPRPRAASSRGRDVRAAGRPALGRTRADGAGRDRRDAPAARSQHGRRADPAGAADRAPARRRQDDPRGGGGTVPQPEDDRVSPAPRLPEARASTRARSSRGPCRLHRRRRERPMSKPTRWSSSVDEVPTSTV